jgi:predicted Fe-Mo cluster-binding NifX family protein
VRIVVPVERPDLNAQVDQRLGRARHFLIVNSEDLSWEAFENTEGSDATQGAGIQAARVIASKSPDVVLAGNCGPKAFRALQAAGIKVCVGVKGTAAEAVKGFLEGRYVVSEGPNVDGHWV